MNGNIVSGSIGIRASSIAGLGGDTSAVTVNFTGNITAVGAAIAAKSFVDHGNGNSGAVSVESNGNLAGGIRAVSSVDEGNGNAGAVEVLHKGSLSGGEIAARSFVGGNGNSGSVIVSNTGNISSGQISAQSIVNGVGNAAAVSVSNAGNITNAGLEIVIAAISQAKNDGDAGSVTVTSNGSVTGRGTGIVALSQAAGAGEAGGVVVSNTGNIVAARGISASSSAAAGNANLVTVTNVGNITASNQFGINISSFAINGNTGPVRVESAGNISAAAGGGILARSVASNGNAGTAFVASNGNINAQDTGILATSFASGVAADVTIRSSGNITAGFSGIVAQSFGAVGQGNIDIAIDSGAVQGGAGAGVDMSGGTVNLLTIGSSASLSSLSGLAIVSNTGNDHIRNSGTVTGNVALGAGVNTFDNFADALFNSGSIVDLGGTGLLTNFGRFAPGGVGTPPITTTLTGGFVQNASGAFLVDVGGGAADRVNVSGAADLAGTVVPTIKGLVSAAQQFTILSAAGGVTNNGITVKDTLIFDYELLFPNANDMVLAVTANFSPGNGAGLTPNQRVTAAHLQSAFNAGGGALGGLFGYLGSFPGVAAYATALDRLHAEPYLVPVKSALLGNLGFHRQPDELPHGGQHRRQHLPRRRTMRLGEDGRTRAERRPHRCEHRLSGQYVERLDRRAVRAGAELVRQHRRRL